MSDESKDVKVPITRPGHIMIITQARVLEDLAEELREIQKDYKLPGVALAVSHVRAKAAEARLESVEANIDAAIKGGINLTNHSLTLKGGADEVFLVGAPIAPEQA